MWSLLQGDVDRQKLPASIDIDSKSMRHHFIALICFISLRWACVEVIIDKNGNKYEMFMIEPESGATYAYTDTMTVRWFGDMDKRDLPDSLMICLGRYDSGKWADVPAEYCDRDLPGTFYVSLKVLIKLTYARSGSI